MGVSEIGFPQNVVYKQRIQTSDTLPVTIGASKYCEFLFDIDAGDRMTPLGIVGWSCNDKTQVFLLDFYMDTNLQTAKLILKNPYATTIAINSLYIDVLYSKQGLDMSEVDVVDNLTTDSAVAALSARQGKILDGFVNDVTRIENPFKIVNSQYISVIDGSDSFVYTLGKLVYFSLRFMVSITTTGPISAMDFKDEYTYLRPVNYGRTNGYVTDASECWSAATKGLLFINSSFKIGVGAGFQTGKNYIAQGIYIRS